MQSGMHKILVLIMNGNESYVKKRERLFPLEKRQMLFLKKREEGQNKSKHPTEYMVKLRKNPAAARSVYASLWEICLKTERFPTPKWEGFIYK